MERFTSPEAPPAFKTIGAAEYEESSLRDSTHSLHYHPHVCTATSAFNLDSALANFSPVAQALLPKYFLLSF